MRAFEPALPLGVAYSGGADSTALLVACVRKWPGQVQAIHVNHGLQAAAAEFESHCQAACLRLGVPLHVANVDAQGGPGQSPEDAARIARYKALSSFASDECNGVRIQSIAIAQHADDQVESILLALGRGAGLAGLSGMPARWRRSGMDFHRPFLHVAGAELRRWLQANAVPFVSDPTNVDTRYTRNHIRAKVLPALQAVFPQFRDTFNRSACHAAQAQSLMEEVAAEDWLMVVHAASGLPQIRGLQALSGARQSNVLRHWLKKDYGVIPSAAQLQELRKQLQACTTRGHKIHLKVGAGFLGRSGATLRWQPS
jgi:tRNA(Ile)-lysidine synthase